MDDVTTAEARKHLADLINRVAYGGERVVITRRGKEIAALVPVEEAGLLRRLRQWLAGEASATVLDELDPSEARAWRDLKEELGL